MCPYCVKYIWDREYESVDVYVYNWGGSRGGSVEPPKLNVERYNKRVVEKK